MAWYDFVKRIFTRRNNQTNELPKPKLNEEFTIEERVPKKKKKRYKRKGKRKVWKKKPVRIIKKQEVIREKNFNLPVTHGFTRTEAISSIEDIKVTKVKYDTIKGNIKEGYRKLLSEKAINTTDSRNLEILDYLANHRSALAEVIRHRISAKVDVSIDNVLSMTFNVSNILLDDAQIIEGIFLHKQFNMSTITQAVQLVEKSIDSARLAGGPVLHVAKFEKGICTGVNIEFSFA